MASPIAGMSQETLREIQQLVGDTRAEQGSIERAYNTAMGLVNYDLQRPAKQTEVFYFPILAMMPHVQGDGGMATNYKVIDAINTGKIEGWVPEGTRQQQIASHLSNASAAYATFGLEDSITFEAKGAANKFEDAMTRMQANLMLETQRRLEKAVAFANANLALGTPTAPTITASTTGGTIAQTTACYVAVVALTAYALEASSVSAVGAVQPVTVVGPDGKNVTNGYGSSMVSLPSNLTTATDGLATHSINASTPAVVGAAGYAWFEGVDATHMYCVKITTTNSAIITAVGSIANQVSTVITVDNSRAPNAFDGLLSLALQNGVVVTQPTGTPGIGTGLTGDGAGGIVEIESLFQSTWERTHTSYKWLIMSAQEAKAIRTKTIAAAAPLYRFNIDAGDTSPITAGKVIGSYLNMFTVNGGELVRIIMHPYCPKGTILAFTDTIPGELIPNSNLGQLFEFHLPSPEDEMHATQWPQVTREYRTGVYIRGVVAHYFPQSMGVINNIGTS